MASNVQRDSPGGRRNHSRLRVHLPARLISLTGTEHVVLRDLSFKGAKVECGHMLRIGSEAVLCWGPFEGFCTVKWADGSFAGLKFDEALDPRVLIATRDLEDSTPHVDPSRLAARAFVRGAIRL